MEYTIYHVTRNLAKHAFELDDKVYGSPLDKRVVDWAVADPGLYVQRLKAEKSLLSARKDDLEYVMREKKIDFESVPLPEMTEAQADRHVYHKFHHRSFTYCEKVSYELQSKSPEHMQLIAPKAQRQLHALNAALEDVEASLVRYSAYMNSTNE